MQTSEKLTLSHQNRVCLAGKYTGYSLSRGDFVDTIQDCCDLFYIDHEDDHFRDRRFGYPTRSEALNAIRRQILGPSEEPFA